MPLPADERTCPAGSTPHITFTLRNTALTAIPLTSMVSLAVTLWDEATGYKIRDGLDILNANNGTMDATTGEVVWYLQVADTTLLSPDPDVPKETRRFVIAFSWTESARTYIHYEPAWYYIVNPYAGAT
jgi:hypothetical protein